MAQWRIRGQSPVKSNASSHTRQLTHQQKEIHAEHHLRDASPAWIVEHEAGVEGEFSYAPDKRTLETRRNRMLIEKRDASTGYKAMKSFVNDFMRKAGKGNVVSKRSVEVDEAPVLKPKKMMRYYFSA